MSGRRIYHEAFLKRLTSKSLRVKKKKKKSLRVKSGKLPTVWKRNFLLTSRWFQD